MYVLVSTFALTTYGSGEVVRSKKTSGIEDGTKMFILLYNVRVYSLIQTRERERARGQMRTNEVWCMRTLPNA